MTTTTHNNKPTHKQTLNTHHSLNPLTVVGTPRLDSIHVHPLSRLTPMHPRHAHTYSAPSSQYRCCFHIAFIVTPSCASTVPSDASRVLDCQFTLQLNTTTRARRNSRRRYQDHGHSMDTIRVTMPPIGNSHRLTPTASLCTLRDD